MASHLALAVVLLIIHTHALPPRVHHDRHEALRGDDEGVEELEDGWKITDLSKFLGQEDLDTMRTNYQLNMIAEKIETVAKPAAFGVDLSSLPGPVREEIQQYDDHGLHDHPPATGDLQDIMMGDAPMVPDYEEEEEEEEKITKVTFQMQYAVGKPVPCHSSKPHTVCLEVTMPPYLITTDLTKLELNIYKEPDAGDAHGREHTFVVHEVQHHHDPHHKQHSRSHVYVDESTSLESGWVHVDVRDIVASWYDEETKVFTGQSPTHVLQVTCKTCESPIVPIRLHTEIDKPYIKIDFKQKKRRVRRHLPTFEEGGRRYCNPDKACCNKKLTVNVTRANDFKWLMRPMTFDINYCEGTCMIMNYANLDEKHQLRQQLLYNYRFQSKVLRMCCVPKTYRSLSVFYMSTDGVMTMAEIPDVVVAGCQCV